MPPTPKPSQQTSLLEGEVTLDRSRFPFMLKVNGKPIATIYTAQLDEVFLNIFNYTSELNRLKRKANQLIDAIETGKSLTHSTLLVPEKETRTTLEADPDTLFMMFGLKVGTVYKSKRAKTDYWYEIEKINSMRQEVTLHWLGSSEYVTTIPIDKLEKLYTVWEEELPLEVSQFARAGGEDD